MSTVLEPGVVQTFIQSKATKYVQVAASAWLGWDHLLTFDRELIFFWWKEWTGYKALFFMNRYFPLVITLLNTGALLSPEDGIEDLNFCSTWLRISGLVTGSLAVIIFHAILVLRINVIYRDNWLIRRSLLMLYIITDTAACITVGLASQDAKYIAHPIPRMTLCSTTMERTRYIWACWSLFLLFEVVVFSLAANKLRLYVYDSDTSLRGRSPVMQILTVMLRDWSVYILLIIPVYIISLLIPLFAPPTFHRILQAPMLCFVSISGTRMMLNVKETGFEARPSFEIDTLDISEAPEGSRGAE